MFEAMKEEVTLLRSGSDNHDGNRAPKDFYVQPDGPVVDVFQIQPDPVFEVLHVVASTHLPEAGQTGLDTETPAMGGVIKALYFINGQGRGPNQGHFPPGHREKVGEIYTAEI